MSMADYLPPIVTELRADITNFAEGFAAATVIVEDFSRDVPQVLEDTFRAAGRDSANAFTTEFEDSFRDFEDDITMSMRNTAHASSEAFWDETNRNWTDAADGEIKKTAAATGAKVGSSFVGSFANMTGAGMPLAIGAALGAAFYLVPAAGAAIGMALSMGIAGGFIGLGAILLKDDKKLKWMAENLGRSFQKIFTKAAMPLQPQLLHALVLIENAVLRAGPRMEKMFSTVAEAVTPLTEGLIEMIKNTGPGLQAVLEVGVKLLNQFGGELPAFGTALSEFLANMAAGGPGMARFMSDLFGFANIILPAVGTALAWLSMRYLDITDAIREFSTWANKAGADVAKWAQGVGKWFSEAWASVKGFAVGAYQAVVDWATGVGAWFASVYAAIAAWVSGAVAWVGSLPGKFMAGLRALPGVLRAAAVKAFDAFFYYAGLIITKTVKFFVVDLPAGIGRGMVWVWQKIVTGWNAVVAWISALPMRISVYFAQIWLDVVAWWNRTSDDVTTTAQALPGKVGAFFSQLYTDVIAWIARTVSDLMVWWDGLPGKIGAALTNLWNTVASWIGTTSIKMYNAGGDIITGLVNGIQDKISASMDVVKRAISRFAQGARDALGIKSPSTVFFKMGVQSIDGYVSAVTSNARRAASAVGRALSPAGTYAMGGGPAASRVLAGMGVGASTSGASGSGTPVILQLDGKTIATALIPHAQRTKLNNNTSGLG